MIIKVPKHLGNLIKLVEPSGETPKTKYYRFTFKNTTPIDVSVAINCDCKDCSINLTKRCNYIKATLLKILLEK